MITILSYNVFSPFLFGTRWNRNRRVRTTSSHH